MAAASSSSVPGFAINREEDPNQMKQHSSTPTNSSSLAPPPPPAQKKKRNQPGTPNPDAEVIALSPKTLMATNRFICEVCNKGFQREQNLQLHRRGHNLPWKLKQKTNKEPKRKVYLCPEPTCVHHDPSRALGDLTGIKKHYSRKHGEKKWKCEKCSKRYAVQSDWKAHSKTCGTREYRCDCGTLFSRRDSFITHRAFCDALAQESARHPPNLSAIGANLYGGSNATSLGLSQLGPQFSALQDQTNQTGDMLRLGGASHHRSAQQAPSSGQFDHGHILSPTSFRAQQQPPAGFFMTAEPNQQQYHHQDDHHHSHHHPHQSQHGFLPNKPFHGLMQFSEIQSNANNVNPSSGLLISNHFNAENGTSGGGGGGEGSNIFSGQIGGDQISSSPVSSLYSTSVQNNHAAAVAAAHMSATALLQKAAQMGSTSTTNNTASLLRSFGSSSSSTAGGGQNKPSDRPTMAPASFGGGGAGGGSIGGGLFGSDNDQNHLQDLMNSFAAAGGNNSMFGGSAFGGYESASRASLEHQDQKLHANSSGGGGGGGGIAAMNNSIGGGSDRLTRDFLGVGQIVRSVSGGFSKREQQQQQQHRGIIEMGSLDSENNAAAPSSGQSFGGSAGNFQ
ncbi:protein indeterminate-domain 5, chloroplastic [Humulus lupulus]|uniref:protein indeterminate-domain 5, chloroplastic n=1 Tax=Humulus lupulus TaxID=3486 RepID=UPI002B405974|nr:protein indeterminate-domain 5, chloroplastic [Humulus lupulus]XP_062113120.1 protein indeterminate-domain 5, chloroplastic [Humulus lupulus]XP_062113121.1 protein indeterminate-domain 5, chloroplastic [Humulus lupulus]